MAYVVSSSVNSRKKYWVGEKWEKWVFAAWVRLRSGGILPGVLPVSAGGPSPKSPLYPLQPALKRVEPGSAPQKWQKWVFEARGGPRQKDIHPGGYTFFSAPRPPVKSPLFPLPRLRPVPGIHADTPGTPDSAPIQHLCSVQRQPMAPISRPPNPTEICASEPRFFMDRRRWVCHLEKIFL
jgi:hypothetical protein